MSDVNETLTQVRNRIDQLDEEIQLLINERAKCAQSVAEVKQRAGDSDANFYRPEREAQVLRKVMERNQGPLPGEEMARLFREIMSACLALEQPMRIAFLGPAGTYTHDAALKQFGHSVTAVPHATIDAVFRDVEAGLAHYGVVPVENSTEGVVNYTLDMFMNSPLQICGEVELRIHHCLLSKESDLGNVKTIYAHQQTLAQCREWLDEHCNQAVRLAVSSNARAAQMVREDCGGAAIASVTAAELYGLDALVCNIEDEPDNTTRFLVIGHASSPASGKDKTSMLLSISNRPGGLVKLLKPLSDAAISMTRIESRPSRRGMWDYVFFIDIEGHQDAPAVAAALQSLANEAAMIKILGSYPVAVL